MIENIGAYSQVDYNRGYDKGRADTIRELRETLSNWFRVVGSDEDLEWNRAMDIILTLLEQLKEQK